MSKPWGNIGAWAADAEEEERQQAEAAAAAALAAPPASFPSLKEAAAVGGGAGNKKKQKNKMSLQQFQTAPVGAGRRDSPSPGLTPDEMLRLPTGPKERSADEMQYGRLGGGFSSYGRSGGGPDRNNRDGDSSWGGGGGGRRSYGGGFEDDRRAPQPRVSEFDGISRADEVDNWAMGKKPLPSMDFGRQNRYAALGGGGGIGIGGGGGDRGFSRADEVDNWGTGKKPFPARSSSFGATFRDPGREREPEGHRWNRGGGFREMEPERERPRLVLNPPKEGGAVVVETVTVKSNKSNPFGAARPREDVLAEKGLDWKKLDLDIEAKKSSRPTSSHSSRPSSAHSNRSEPQALQGVEGLVVKPRPKVNPFGDAKPREVLLEQKGLDWRKIDLELEHRRVDRPETEAEKKLKEEIDHLKNELEKQSSGNANRGSLDASSEDQLSLSDLIHAKEKDLELLIRELDDKVRFGQRSLERPGSGAGRSPHFADRPGSGAGRSPHFSDRPGSGAGRAPHFSDRPPSQSGASDDSRNVEFVDRPRSRGTGDVWPRQFDDRKPFQGGRERGFLGNRGLDRSSSRERW